jgi:hypothetical protein
MVCASWWRYTAKADQQLLSGRAGEMLMANLRKGLVIDDANTMKGIGRMKNLLRREG